MNKIISLCISIFAFNAMIFAQAPQKMSYQAIIRNASNALVINTSIGMRISILQGSAAGTPVYVETQTRLTDINGLVSLAIGAGTPVSGSMSAINWATGPYFIKTETDPTGGIAFSVFGSTELLSVPYAFFAGSTNTAWSLLGNTGTLDATSFIGTIDNIPLNIRVNNQRAGRIDHLLNNTAFGFLADVNTPGITNATAIGANALVSASNSLVLGNNANIGVGVSAPKGKMHINSNNSINYGIPTLAATTSGLISEQNLGTPQEIAGITAYGDGSTLENEGIIAAAGGSSPFNTGGVFISQTSSTGINVGVYGRALAGSTNYAGWFVGDVRIQDGTEGPGKLYVDGGLGNGTGKWSSIAAIGLITGTGTLNYVPRWTGSGATIGNSQIIDNGTNVGINQAVPAAKLDVNGTFKLTDGTQADGKILTSNASGNASWQSSKVSIRVNGITSDLTVPHNSHTLITQWASVSSEEGGPNYTPANGEYLITKTGVYNIEAHLFWLPFSAPGTASVWVWRNGLQTDFGIAAGVPGAGINIGTTVNTSMLLNSGDRITIRAYQTSGVPQTVSGVLAGSGGNHFSISLEH
jgi:hypothetical protein